jgi:hypothetical protein
MWQIRNPNQECDGISRYEVGSPLGAFFKALREAGMAEPAM